MKLFFWLPALWVWAGPPAAAPPDSARAVAISPAAAVYVCVSKSSVAYHGRAACAALRRCTHEVRPVSAAEAQALGKRACRVCL